MARFLFALALFFIAPIASAQTPIYSKAFYGDSSGSYVNNADAKNGGCARTNNCNVALSGTDALPILVNPWEPVSINILCVQVIVLPYENPGSYFYAFAGNSFSPDVMVWGVSEGNGAIGSKLCYPPGTAFPFPAAGQNAPENKPGQNNFAEPHLDVHVMGNSSVQYQAYLEVWYTKNPQ